MFHRLISVAFPLHAQPFISITLISTHSNAFAMSTVKYQFNSISASAGAAVTSSKTATAVRRMRSRRAEVGADQPLPSPTRGSRAAADAEPKSIARLYESIRITATDAFEVDRPQLRQQSAESKIASNARCRDVNREAC
jgi:hypothetical protein